MNMQQLWDKLGREGTWQSYYDTADPLRSYNFTTRREAVARLLENEGKFERALDIGCGTGDYIDIAEDHGAQFFGIDYAEEMIRKGVIQNPGHGKTNLFVVGGGDKLPFADNTFDVAWGMGYIEYFAKPQEPLAEIRRVLKPGGFLVLQSFKWSLFSNFRRLVWQPMRSALGMGPKHELPSDWVNNKYTRGQLDALVAKQGFVSRGGVFNNFHVLPTRWRAKFPGTYIRASELINNTAPGAFGFLAANYVGKYQLEGKDAATNGAR